MSELPKNLDGDPVEQMLGNMHLFDCAKDWERIAENMTLPWPVRHDAQENADCIWAELCMRPGKR